MTIVIIKKIGKDYDVFVLTKSFLNIMSMSDFGNFFNSYFIFEFLKIFNY